MDHQLVLKLSQWKSSLSFCGV